jgi:hypothetical protein
MAASHPSPLALDADAALDPADHIVGQAIDHGRVKVR